jgi:hypothetical protein
MNYRPIDLRKIGGELGARYAWRGACNADGKRLRLNDRPVSSRVRRAARRLRAQSHHNPYVSATCCRLKFFNCTIIVLDILEAA